MRPTHAEVACEQALLFGRAKRAARERASERRSRESPKWRACSQANAEVIYRPHSRYQLSLHEHEDWWDQCNVTWFLRRQTSDKICQYKKSRLYVFIFDNRK